MSSEIKEISKVIGHNAAGIIWLTDDELKIDSKGVYEFNYLLDGLLIKYLKDIDKSKKSNFFLGKSFGKPFFIGHTIIEKDQNINDMFTHLEIGKHHFGENPEIFILNKSQNTGHKNVLKELKNKYPKIQFKHLLI